MTPDLIAAYRATEYRIETVPPLIARIGMHDPAMDALLAWCGVRAAAFLTAFNPRSRPTGAADNADAQERLGGVLQSLGLASISGLGVGADGDWPPEPSVLILGVCRQKAEDLARDFSQNAFVWIAAGAAPELVLTPNLPPA